MASVTYAFSWHSIKIFFFKTYELLINLLYNFPLGLPLKTINGGSFKPPPVTHNKQLILDFSFPKDFTFSVLDPIFSTVVFSIILNPKVRMYKMILKMVLSK